MSDDGQSGFKDQGLDQFLKLIKSFRGTVKVGILGDKNSRSGSTQTNVEIGAKHEFGADGMPQRSFLRVPLTDHLGSYLDNTKGLFTEASLQRVIKDKSLVPWLKNVGVIAENVVADAFSSDGFGKWPAWAPGYENNTGMILVDTQQLRDSISSKVEESHT